MFSIRLRCVFLILIFAVTPISAQRHEICREGKLLAHSLNFDPTRSSDNMPEALTEMLRAYKTQTRYANRTQGKAVAPLLKSIRNQSVPFNNSCPYYLYNDSTLSTTRCLTGCVATSIEQVVSYWHHPEALVDTLHGWQTEHYTIPDVLPSTPIDWNNILDDYSNGYTDAQAKAVADLTYYCGVAAHMSWTPTSSGANLYRAFEPLWRSFDFKTIAFVQRVLYSPQAWDRMLRNELENGRPICYTGHNMALSGHAFNIDGVDEQGYYHINWGYGGQYDGYFDLDFLNPFEQQSDETELGQQEGFFSNQTALFMHPEDFVIDIFDTVPEHSVLYGVSVDTITFRRPADTQCYVIADATFHNNTQDSINFTFEALTYLQTDTAIFQQADYVGLSSVNLAPGETKVWPLYLQFMESGNRTLALSSDDSCFVYQMPIVVGEGTAPILSFGDVSHKLTHYEDNLTATLSLDVTNNATKGYAGNLLTYCLEPADGSPDQRHWHVLSLAAGETENLAVTFQHLTDGQQYTFRVRCPWTTHKTFTFTARMEDAEDAIISLKSDGTSSKWYDLQGRENVRPVRGIYVKNGKKILIH